MPTFYLSVRDGDDIAPDLEGSEFSNLEAALLEATESAREVLVDTFRQHRPVGAKTIEITDENGTVVGMVAIRDLFE